MMKANNQLGFININEDSIDEIIKDGEVIFERGFLREKTSTTLPITFGGVGKDLKDYKIYGNTKQQLLPDEYTQVEYIKNTGLQYIDTGVYGNLNTEIRVKASSNGESAQLFGDITTQSKAISCNFGFAQAIGSRFGNKNVAVILGNYITTDIPFELIENKNGMYIDNVEVIAFDTTDEFTTTNTLLLLNRNSSSGATANRGFGNLYNCEIYDGNTLIRNFIPCYRNSDNEVGLYDLVNGAFYTNQGTGVFTYGDIVPTPETEVEIISCGDRTKNLLNYAKWTNAYIGANGVIYTDNSYKNALFEDYIEVKPNTKYTMSTKTTVNNIGVNEFDSSKTFIKRNQFAYDVSQGTIITTNDTRFIRISINYDGSSAITDNIINNLEPMLELGEIRTSYEPYGYKIPVDINNNITDIYLDEPLRKIDEYSDYIDFINGKIVRNIKEIILDGSEDWASASASNIYSRFVCTTYNDALIPQNLSTIGKILSDKFISKTANETASAITGIAIAGSGRIVIYYDLTKDYTITQFKTWLSSNNVTVDYALTTPTEETITLPNIPTIDGNNILNIETEITPSQVYIKYKSNE